MALINCPECQKEVSDKATKCTNCGIRLRKPKRSFFGKLVKCAFIIFNLVMAFLLFYIWDSNGLFFRDLSDAPVLAQIMVRSQINDVITKWVTGAIILGLMVLFTRPKE